MKKLLLLLSLITLFSCSKEEVSPNRMAANEARFTIDTEGEYAFAAVYYRKDKYLAEEPYIKVVEGKNDTTITVPISREQNFGYAIQSRDSKKKVKVRFQFNDHDNTKEYTGSNVLTDIYEFYKQAL